MSRILFGTARAVIFMTTAFVVAVAVTRDAYAHTFCVNTSSELASALAKSSDGGVYASQDNEIDVAKGTYKTGSATSNGPFYYSSTTGNALSIIGGFKSGCPSFEFDATTSILDGNHATRVLELHGHGTIAVEELTIQNGESTSNGAGLVVDSIFGDVGNVYVENNIIQNNHTTQQNGGFTVENGGSTNYLNFYVNLVVNNSADMGDGAGEILGNGTAAYIVNNVMYGNKTSASGGTGGLYYGGIARAQIDNNIFKSNSNFGLELGASTGVYLRYNDFGTRTGLTPQFDIGNTAADPEFVDASSGDFHLSATSPLLGYSYENGDGGYDMNGHFISENGPVDLGVYQDTLFKNGFETPAAN